MSFFEKAGSKKSDIWLSVLFFGLLLIGFVILTSSSIGIGDKIMGDKYYYMKQQFIKGIIPAVAIFLFFSYFNYKKVKRLSTILFFVSLFLLVAVLIMGMASGGSRSWIDIGIFSFQPSEIAKIAQVVFLAAFFEKMGKNIKDKKDGLVPYLLIIGIPFLLILLQPDLGTLSIFFVICIAMFFVAGGRITHVISICLITILMGAIVLKVDNGTRLERIDVFFHPEKYSTQGDGYHINQAMIAVGTGGMFGRGFGRSVQKFSYLPQVIGDSIFAVMAEEFGFILTSVILGLYFFMLYRFVLVAKQAPDNFSKYFVIGVAVWIGTQVFINVGAMIRLFPLTGVPLPFVSWGSTSMWVLAAACGIVSNISRYSEISNDGRLVKKRNTILLTREK